MNAGSSVTPRLSTKHAAQAPDRAAADAGSVSITWYENEIPSFAEAALERIYGSIFSSLAHFRIHGGAENAGCWPSANPTILRRRDAKPNPGRCKKPSSSGPR